jgi:(2R)-3-sulfolactate dehydrogenase (NADP+)
MKMNLDEAHEFVRRAAVRAGASDAIAGSLARAVVSAERRGNRAVGFAHVPDYLDGFVKGRISRDAAPEITPDGATIRVDAKGGIAQTGFDLAFDALVERARTQGVALFLQKNSFTVGELGWYTRRLARAGLVAFAASNAPALMTTIECREPLLGTNPLSFAAPLGDDEPLVVDQSTSATAFVNVRRAAIDGTPIPEGWAVDRHGNPTTDSREAVHGALLAFGGARGANIALMVEMLAAGMTGANWSLDAPSFAEGGASPAVGLFVMAMALPPDAARRMKAQIDRLAERRLRIPGRRPHDIELDIPDEVIARIRSFDVP